MTVREYLDMLHRDQDSRACNACGSSEICPDREAEARVAGVEGLPRYVTRPKPPGRAQSPRIAKNGAAWYWTGTKWRKRKAG